MTWALCYGHEPDQRVRDQLRHLRQLGIPEAAGKEAKGSGNRIAYDFFNLVETGLGPSAARSASRNQLAQGFAAVAARLAGNPHRSCKVADMDRGECKIAIAWNWRNQRQPGHTAYE